MFNWNGCSCSVCKEAFTENDDIVVCPECGTPYHRECYAKEGHCKFAAKHGTGYAYQAPQLPILGMECPSCHSMNNKGTLFCHNCGTPLAAPNPDEEQLENATPQNNTSAYRPGAGYSSNQPNGMNGGNTQSAFAASAWQAALPHQVDGITAAEWTDYIGNSAPYYLLQFKRMDDTHRNTSFCWSALFLGPLYFFFRKMWGWGVLSAIGTVLVSVPSLLQMLVSMNAIQLTMSNALLDSLGMISFFANWAMSFAFGIFAFYLFRKHAAKKIQAMKAAASDESAYRNRLARTGGPSYVAVTLLLVALFVASGALGMWIGPEKVLSYYYF